MPEHTGRVELVGHGGPNPPIWYQYRAYCWCGWEDTDFYGSAAEAEDAWRLHERDELA